MVTSIRQSNSRQIAAAFNRRKEQLRTGQITRSGEPTPSNVEVPPSTPAESPSTPAATAPAPPSPVRTEGPRYIKPVVTRSEKSYKYDIAYDPSKRNEPGEGFTLTPKPGGPTTTRTTPSQIQSPTSFQETTQLQVEIFPGSLTDRVVNRQFYEQSRMREEQNKIGTQYEYIGSGGTVQPTQGISRTLAQRSGSLSGGTLGQYRAGLISGTQRVASIIPGTAPLKETGANIIGIVAGPAIFAKDIVTKPRDTARGLYGSLYSQPGATVGTVAADFLLFKAGGKAIGKVDQATGASTRLNIPRIRTENVDIPNTPTKFGETFRTLSIETLKGGTKAVLNIVNTPGRTSYIVSRTGSKVRKGSEGYTPEQFGEGILLPETKAAQNYLVENVPAIRDNPNLRNRLSAAQDIVLTSSREAGVKNPTLKFEQEGIRNTQTYTQVIGERIVQDKGRVFGSQSTQLNPKPYKVNLGKSDVDISAPVREAIIAKRNIITVQRLQQSGERVGVSKQNPLIIETRDGRKLVEIHSTKDPTELSGDPARGGVFNYKFDQAGAYARARVGTNKVPVTILSEQTARKGSAANILRAPTDNPEIPKSLQTEIVGTKPSRGKDLPDFIIQGRAKGESLRQKGKVEEGRKVDSAVDKYLDTFNKEQKADINKLIDERLKNPSVEVVTSKSSSRSFTKSPASASGFGSYASPSRSPSGPSLSKSPSQSPYSSPSSPSPTPRSPYISVPSRPPSSPPSYSYRPRSPSSSSTSSLVTSSSYSPPSSPSYSYSPPKPPPSAPGIRLGPFDLGQEGKRRKFPKAKRTYSYGASLSAILLNIRGKVGKGKRTYTGQEIRPVPILSGKERKTFKAAISR